MIIQHNLTAINANRMLGVTTTTQAKTSERLSSGYKINRAADDAAGLSISEKMRKQVRGLGRASTNANDGISSVQTAEGALNEIHDMMQRLNELSVQAANGTNSYTDREAIQNEIDQILTEVDRVAETTKFNETYLLKGAQGNRLKYMKAHDAGLDGVLGDSATVATFTMQLKMDSNVRIAGKEYHIGMGQLDTTSVPNAYKGPDSLSFVQDTINSQKAIGKAGQPEEFTYTDTTVEPPVTTMTMKLESYPLSPITIDGTQYDAGWSSTNPLIPVYKFGESEYTKEEIAAMIVDGSKVSINNYDMDFAEPLKDYVQLETLNWDPKNVMANYNPNPEGPNHDIRPSITDTDNPNNIRLNNKTFTAMDATLDKNIIQNVAIEKSIEALKQANRIGVDPDKARDVDVQLTFGGRYGVAAPDESNPSTYVGQKYYKTEDIRDYSHSVDNLVSIISGRVQDGSNAEQKAQKAGEQEYWQNAYDEAYEDYLNYEYNNGYNNYMNSSKVVDKNNPTDAEIAAAEAAGNTNKQTAISNGSAQNYAKNQANGAKNEAEAAGWKTLKDVQSITGEILEHGKGEGYFGFYITKQYATVPKDLGLSLHVGSEADLGNKISVNLEAMKAANLGIQNLNVKDTTGMAATYAIDAIEDALRQVSAQRSALGAVQNRVEHTINNLDNVVENTTAAESRIRDTNMAEAMVEYSKMNILAQAGQSMLAQANQSTQGVMSLLQ